MPSLTFRPLDLVDDAALLLGFMREVFAVSFDEGRFAEEFGADGAGYFAWLGARLAEDPGDAVLALEAGEVVGLVITGRCRNAPAIGYVYTYYLAPHARGRRLADRLDDHAMATLRARGYGLARLSVAEKNRTAMKFYARRGWRPVGPRADQPGVIFLEKATSEPG
jgi:ribosomal protein S18 acetylase RimI-like enzyme